MGQIVSYMSLMLTIGNIFACMVLSRQHRISSHMYSENAVSTPYSSRRSYQRSFLRTL